MYKGRAPATEPEVKAVMQLCKQNDFLLAASFHTKGEVIYWADSGTKDAIEAGSSIAQTLADVTGYELMPVSEDASVYGAGFENWFRQDYGRPAFCIELTPAGNGSAPHDDAQFTKIIWDKAKFICAELLEQAVK
jgi:g-D-glutamyl-meso-diaminopimelate peptidase